MEEGKMLAWQFDGYDLVAAQGSQRWLAERVRQERARRGWSQTALSKELRKVGHYMHQSAISKIESPKRGEPPRVVTIDEAIGFAKVFEISLGEILLPPDAAAMGMALRRVSEGPRLLLERARAERVLTNTVEAIAKEMATQPSLRDFVLDLYDREYRMYTSPGVAAGRRYAEAIDPAASKNTSMADFLWLVISRYQALEAGSGAPTDETAVEGEEE